MKQDIGERIAALRKSRNLKQKDVSFSLGIDITNLSRIETGTSYPTIETLAKLCELFGVSADYILGIEKGQIIGDADIKATINLPDLAIEKLKADTSIGLYFGTIIETVEFDEFYIEFKKALFTDGEAGIEDSNDANELIKAKAEISMHKAVELLGNALYEVNNIHGAYKFK
jgi:transcriptional regulator with XRE-family HTH domain